MTSPNHDTPTTPGWASPTGGPADGPQDSPGGAAAPPAAPSYQGGPAYPAAPAPGYGTGPGYPAAPGYGAAPGYPAAPGYGPPMGYRPPAVQPGIIPLRPLGLGEILDGAFRAIRFNPRVMFGLTALVVTITVALQTVFQWYVGGLLTGNLADAVSTVDPTGEFALADTIDASVTQALAAPAIALATTVLTGLLIVSVSRSVLGQTVTIGEVWRGYRGRVGLVVVFTIGLFLASTLGLAALVAIVAVAAVNGETGAAVVLGLVGGLLFLVTYVWLLVRTLLIPPAIMLEGAGLGSALKRGWTLSRGSFWRLFGIYLLTSIIVGIVSALITAPASLLTTFVFQDPLNSSFGSLAVVGVASIVALTLTTVFTAAVVALLYVDVRMRREGLDVELARAAGEPAA